MKKKITNMTEGTPIKLILAFAVPMLIGNIFQQFYNFVDAAIVGKYVGADALAAVGTTGSMNGLLISLAMGLTNGAGIIIAQCFGAKDKVRMKKAVTAMIWVLAAVTAIITIGGILLSYPAMRLLKVPEDIIGDSVAYMRIVFGCCAAMIGYNGCSAILRNLGDSKTPLYMLIISSITNVILDLVFVVVFNWGVKGVALATAIAQMLSGVLCFGYLYKHREELYLSNIPFKPEKEEVKKIFRMGIPSALQTSLISLGGISVQGLVNSFGTHAIAAYTASTKIDSIAIQIVVSIAVSLSVFSGQNRGAGNIDRIKKGLRQTLSVMVPTCVFIAVFMLIFKRQMLSLLLDPATAGKSIEIGATYLSIIGIGYIIAGVMQSFLNLIRGAGDVNVSMAAGIAELSMRVIASYVLVQFWGLTGIWIAVPISWACGCSIPVIRYFSGKWINKGVIK